MPSVGASGRVTKLLALQPVFLLVLKAQSLSFGKLRKDGSLNLGKHRVREVTCYDHS